MTAAVRVSAGTTLEPGGYCELVLKRQSDPPRPWRCYYEARTSADAPSLQFTRLGKSFSVDADHIVAAHKLQHAEKRAMFRVGGRALIRYRANEYTGIVLELLPRSVLVFYGIRGGVRLIKRSMVKVEPGAIDALALSDPQDVHPFDAVMGYQPRTHFSLELAGVDVGPVASVEEAILTARREALRLLPADVRDSPSLWWRSSGGEVIRLA